MLEAMVWQFLLFCPSKYGDFPPFLLKIPLLHSQPFFFLSPSGEILPKEKNAAQNPYIPSGNSRYIPKGQLLQAVRRHLYKPQIIATPPS
jgi:hypothetical protein